MQVLSRIKMEIRPNFGGVSPGFFFGVGSLSSEGFPDFRKQGRLPFYTPPRTPMLVDLLSRLTTTRDAKLL